jgi:hypothetical protein
MEVVLGLGIAALALMAMASVCASAMRASQKGIDRGAAAAVADRQLTRQIQLVQDDSPAGDRARLWDQEFPFTAAPFSTGQEQVGSMLFQYAIYASTVRDAGGWPVGGAMAGNRLKKMDIVVWWMSQDGSRAGYGQLQYQTSRVISEQGNEP